jgi:acyl-ACP thioesterase
MPAITPLELVFAIKGYDCGYGGPLKPLALANMLQEAAGTHAERLGLGRTAMQSAGHTWMQVRTNCRLYRQPLEGETVHLATWPAATEKLFALRDFELCDSTGLVIGAASYAYLIVDMASRRPLRPQGILPPDLAAARPRALAEPRYSCRKATAGFVEAYRQTACPRHIDHNGHVNNAHLIAWLCDAVPEAARGAGMLAGLCVEFTAEVLPGDELSVVYAPLPLVDPPAQAGRKTGPGQLSVDDPALAGMQFHAAELRRGDSVCARADMVWC